MGMIGELFRSLRRQGGGAPRHRTPAEVRELIDAGRLDEARSALDHLPPNLAHAEAQRACLEGEILFRERRDEDAAGSFRRALADHPGMAAAHYGLSLVLAEAGQLDDAVLHAQFAVDMEPTAARFLAQMGYCHLRLDNFQAAETPLRRATRLSSANPYLWNNLGIVLRAKGDAQESRECFRHAVRLQPDFEAAVEHLAQLERDIAALQLNRTISLDASEGLQADAGEPVDEAFAEVGAAEAAGELQLAIKACEALELSRPDDEQVPITLSRLYERVGEADTACDALMAFLSRHPDSAGAKGTLGLVLLRIHRLAAAERWLSQAVDAQPDNVPLLLGLSAALARQDRFEEAAPWIQKAAELAPEDPAISGQLAANLVNRCRYDEGLAIVEALEARGITAAGKAPLLSYMGRFEESLAVMNADIALRPRDPAMRVQRAMLNLLLGHWTEGWDDYAYRGHSGNRDFRMLPFPRWHGEPLQGKRIIVLAEQGLGDQIMFSSCLLDLAALGPSQIVVEMNQRVAATIARSFPAMQVLATSQGNGLEWAKDFPDTDYFVHLGDLPRHFRQRLSDFPVHHGYLVADPARVAHWRARLLERGPGPWIGMSWKGGTELTRSPVRSMTPEHFLPLARATEAGWVCLQYGDVEGDVARAAAAGLPLAYWPEAIKDLDEFAALISALDLVVTVCNTTVHYAGALNKPVWVLAPRVPEWRYGVVTEHMPWYPSSRLFRQQEDQNWQHPIDAICRKLSLRWPRSPATDATAAES